MIESVFHTEFIRKRQRRTRETTKEALEYRLLGDVIVQASLAEPSDATEVASVLDGRLPGLTIKPHACVKAEVEPGRAFGGLIEDS
jgi:hypothetical protein